MNVTRLIVRSLWHYRRTNGGVLLGAAIGTAVLAGALLVGDSMRGTLRYMTALRIGNVNSAMFAGDRFVGAHFAGESNRWAAVLMTRAVVNTQDTNRRANDVQLLGVDRAFWQLAIDDPQLDLQTGEVAVNQRLARQLKVNIGDVVIFRIAEASAMSRDVPLAANDNLTVGMRLTIAAIVTDEQFGRFDLSVGQTPPSNAFVPRDALAQAIGQPRRANLLLAPAQREIAQDSFKRLFTMADAQLFWRGDLLMSERVFIDNAMYTHLADQIPATTSLTYFVNALEANGNTTPYSTVTATDDHVTQDMANDEILINQWLADDLNVKPGDTMTLTFDVPGSGRTLTQQSATFTVRDILPMEHPALDRALMPDIPGLSDADNCRDWEIGIDIDYDAIRDKDEQYWDTYGGTPKAIISYAAGHELWANRFGSATAMRVDEPYRKEINQLIAPIGLQFTDVRAAATQATEQSLDFGGLFIGMSFFIIIAAAALTGLLFVFGIEQRSKQIGTLLAIGWTPRKVGRVLMIEGMMLAVLGGMIGTALGAVYTRGVLYGLRTVWRDAVVDMPVAFHATTQSLVIGGIGGAIIALMAMWLTLRRQLRRPAKELLSGAGGETFRPATRLWSHHAGFACMVVALVVTILSRKATGQQAAGVFFGVGALMLAATLFLAHALLTYLNRPAARDPAMLSLATLGLRHTARRKGRSLATIALLASGCFLVVAVAANRHDPAQHADRPTSGTGGFELFGRTTLPLLHDLNTAKGRAAFALDDELMQNVTIVPLRVREGDDASCLNLNRAQRPQLLGVDPARLQNPQLFGVDWSQLQGDRAIGDTATITWGLHKKVGDAISYDDESGEAFEVAIAAVMPNSILQGSLIIAEQDFEQRFPSQSGYHMLLIDCPPQKVSDVRDHLSRALGDIGLELTPASERLAMFTAVEHAYLSIFGALGGLGMLLGTVGLGLVVARNILERRGELAALTALGFRRRRLLLLVFTEHGALLEGGLACAIVAATFAVWPTLWQHPGDIPWMLLVSLVVAIYLSGMAWVFLATMLSLRGRLLDALRSE